MNLNIFYSEFIKISRLKYPDRWLTVLIGYFIPEISLMFSLPLQCPLHFFVKGYTPPFRVLDNTGLFT